MLSSARLVLYELKKMLRKAVLLLEKAEKEMEQENALRPETCRQLEWCAEKTALCARELPACFPYMDAHGILSQAAGKVLHCRCRLIPGTSWLHLHIPALLPRKEHGSPVWIRSSAQMCLEEYFQKHPRIFYAEPCCIVFVHSYPKDWPQKQMRDHDNIELNALVDTIASWTLTDDGPMKLSHYYCSRRALKSGTDIYLVPRKDLLWFFRNLQDQISDEEGDAL